MIEDCGLKLSIFVTYFEQLGLEDKVYLVDIPQCIRGLPHYKLHKMVLCCIKNPRSIDAHTSVRSRCALRRASVRCISCIMQCRLGRPLSPLPPEEEEPPECSPPGGDAASPPPAPAPAPVTTALTACTNAINFVSWRLQ